MGLSADVFHTLLGLWKCGHFTKADSVLELGTQELHLTFDTFDSAINAYCIPGYVADDFLPWEWETHGRCRYASEFYKLLGFKKYTCLDMNSEHDAMPHDLNYPFEDRSLWNQFDLVTDYGCAEHAFNVSEAFRTMHRLCKPNGLIISHQLHSQGNGYYLFEPGFYEDIAAANGYDIIFCAMTVSNIQGSSGPGGSSWMLPLSYELMHLLDRGKLSAIGMIYVMKKNNDKDFILPYQGKFMSIKYHNMGYETSAFTNYTHPSRSYVPIIDLSRNISSKKFKQICKAYFSRKLMSWLKR
ncbi:methyltransferase domain-containing protein [Desulfovibrio aminophilus]|uniref:methyltransferase domain-containing protein n=1 Tax=Desulfovibrio aminophilus TaxID=81425 RepID=UPI00339773D4